MEKTHKGVLSVDIDKIENELLCSRVLVDNRIEPYYALDCLKRGDYDLEAFCLPCPRFFHCMEAFVKGDYLIVENILDVNKD
jgi:hypothetical protein